MYKVLFLSDPSETAPRDNIHTLPRAFAQAGWQIGIETHALSWHHGNVYAGKTCLQDADLVWPLGLGDRRDFIDRMQLLAHSGARLINPPQAYLLLHGKLMWADLLPPTHASNRFDDLVNILTQSTGEWILKPAAGSFGREVHRLFPDDGDLLRTTMQTNPGEWFALQQYVPAISAGEHRSLLIGDGIIGSYRRIPHDGLRANLATGGRAQSGAPGSEEVAIIEEVKRRLQTQGVGFAAIDTSGRYLVEVNVANPGGLGTLNEVYAQDFGEAVVANTARWLEAIKVSEGCDQPHAAPATSSSDRPVCPVVHQGGGHASE